MADAGLLTLRIYGMYECPVRNTFCGNITRKINREDGMLSVRSVKLFAGTTLKPPPNRKQCKQLTTKTDGALGSWGAAMLEPYTDKPSISGTMLIEETPLISVVKQVPPPFSHPDTN